MVNRYEPNFDRGGGAHRSASGRFVLHSDYATLAAEVERLRKGRDDFAEQSRRAEDFIVRLTSRAEKAEAEIERLTKRCDDLLAEVQRAWNERDGEKLKASRAEASTAVKVLEWEERSGALYAEAVFGEGCIDQDGGGYHVIQNARMHGGFASVEAAQAFVQSRHDKWVSDWLEPAALTAEPAAPQPVALSKNITQGENHVQNSDILPASHVGVLSFRDRGALDADHPACAGGDSALHRPMASTERSTLAATPAAPQEAEAVAFDNEFAAVEQSIAQGARRSKHRFKLDDTSPPAQAVTEAQVEAAVQAVRKYTRETLFIDEHRELVRNALTAAQEASR